MEISIIIPVYRENQSIVRTLDRLNDIFSPFSHEIILVDGEASASTTSFLRSTVPDQKNIHLITSPRGRGPQMNAGADAARGGLFFFVHADSHPEPDGARMMIDRWRSRPADRFCGAFDLVIDSDKPIFRVIEKTASIRSRLTRIPYGDQGIFISRILFKRLGGFPDLPLMEDVGLMSAVKKAGVRPVFISRRMHTSARRWEAKGVVRTTLSNWIFITLYNLGVSPERLARIYYK